MNPERWQKLRRIYQSAVELAPGQRDAYLREACAGDEDLLGEVRSLLAQVSGGEFDSPALAAAARALVPAVPGGNPRRIAGTDDATMVDCGPQMRVVFSRRYREMSIWRMPSVTSREQADPVRVVSSTGQEHDPNCSPNGKRIAFRSDRTGFAEIHLCSSDGSDPVQLTHFRGAITAGAPR